MTKTKETWLKEFPVLKNIIPGNEIFWINPFYSAFENAQNKLPLTNNDILDAEERLKRFAPFIASVFPETSAMDGIIESPLQKVPELQKSMERISGKKIDGRLLLKCDSHLAISGSIKARGGIYEVLKHAETLAISHGLISKEDDFTLLDSDKFRDFFFQIMPLPQAQQAISASVLVFSEQLWVLMFISTCHQMRRNGKKHS